MARPTRKDADYFIQCAIEKAKTMLLDRVLFGKKFKRTSIPAAVKLKVIVRDKLVCIQCKKSLKLKEINKNKVIIKDAEFHHIIPMIYGGPNTFENICLLCESCHQLVHSGKEKPEKYYRMYEHYIIIGHLGALQWGEKNEGM